MRRLLAVEEAARGIGVRVAAPDEHGGRQLGDPERADELGLRVGRAVGECPGAVVHGSRRYGRGRTESARGDWPDETAVERLAALSRRSRDAPRHTARSGILFAGPRVGGGSGWSRKRPHGRPRRRRAPSRVPARSRRRLPQPRLVRRLPAARLRALPGTGSASSSSSRWTSSSAASRPPRRRARELAALPRRGGAATSPSSPTPRPASTSPPARSTSGPATRCSRPTSSTARATSPGSGSAAARARATCARRSRSRSTGPPARRGALRRGDRAHAGRLRQPRHVRDRARPARWRRSSPAPASSASPRSSTAPTRPPRCRSTSRQLGADFYAGNAHKWLVRAEGRRLPPRPARAPGARRRRRS